MHLRFWLGSFVCLWLCLSDVAMAKTRQVEVYMTSMQAKKVINENGDHLYFNVNVYPTDGSARVLRVPDYPDNWESRVLPCVKDVRIWHGQLNDDNSVVVLMGIFDQSFPLFEPENSIGSVMVEFINKNNRVEVKWGLPNFVDQPKVEQTRLTKPEFIMYGNNSQYVVKFKTNVK